MKKLSFLFLVILTFTLRMSAQVPQGINYQTVVRNNSGAIISNQNVNFRLSIISGSPTGNIEYIEAHSVATNSLGLVNLVIGQGTPLQDTFSTIKWGSASHYLSVELDPAGGTAFQPMGTSQLMSVPYALSAGNSSTSMAQLTDVKVTGVTDGQTLKWNSAQSKWLPANDIGGGTGDNWGTQTVQTNSSLSGAGTTASPLQLSQQSATNGQVLKWNGTSWLPAVDNNTDAQTLSVSGTSLSISGGNTVTLPSSSSSMKVLNATNQASFISTDGDVIKVEGTININGNYNNLGNSNITLMGGVFSGTGILNISTNTTFINTSFSGMTFGSTSSTTFINCSFSNVASFPFDCTLMNCRLTGCNTTTASRIGNIQGGSISNSNVSRILSVSDCTVSSSTLGGTSSSSTCNQVKDCKLNSSFIYIYETFSSNVCDETFVSVRNPSWAVSVTGNTFQTSSMTSSIIDVDCNSGSVFNCNVIGNVFRGSTTYPTSAHVRIYGSYTGTRALVKVSENSFIGGSGGVVSAQQSGTVSLAVNGNDYLYTGALGVSNGGLISVRDNFNH